MEIIWNSRVALFEYAAVGLNLTVNTLLIQPEYFSSILSGHASFERSAYLFPI
jgi:hypothetical protein